MSSRSSSREDTDDRKKERSSSRERKNKAEDTKSPKKTTGRMSSNKNTNVPPISKEDVNKMARYMTLKDREAEKRKTNPNYKLNMEKFDEEYDKIMKKNY
jgi:hypothetical protein